MWKSIGEWFGALLITAAMAVSVFGVVEWIENRGVVVPVLSDSVVTVVIDAGHGGSDGGAKGGDSQVQEAKLNLAVAKLLEQKLTDAGLQVKMTRTDDQALASDKQADMQRRRVLFNEEQVDLVVSIHMNSFPDRSISGAMAYYMAGSKEGQKLAQTVIDSVCDGIGRSRRLANPGDYFVLRECSCPAVLVECGFLSNSEDEKLLQDAAHQEKLASAIADGIRKYLEN